MTRCMLYNSLLFQLNQMRTAPSRDGAKTVFSGVGEAGAAVSDTVVEGRISSLGVGELGVR